ncbi:MAG: Pr6Pr family membrane protein [Microbacterium sp.]
MAAPVPPRTGVRTRIDTAWPFLRTAVAVLLLIAVGVQFHRTVSVYAALPEPYASHVPTLVTNFFSYFTNLANIAAAAVLIAAAIWAWTRGRRAAVEPAGLALALVAVATYMVLTGTVYNALLRGTGDPLTFVRFSNEVTHVAGPAFLLLDALIAPKRRALPWRSVWLVVSVPLAWCVYTLVRAPFIVEPSTGVAGFYPYPFLNPRVQDGFGGVAAYIAVLATAVVVLSALLVWIGRLRAGENSPARAEAPGA